MPRINVAPHPSGIAWVWLILAVILLVVSLGGVLYYLSGFGFKTESMNKQGTIKLKKSIQDTEQPMQWAYSQQKLESIAEWSNCT